MKSLSAIFATVVMMLALVSCGRILAEVAEAPEPPELPESLEHENPEVSEAYEKYIHISEVLEAAGSIKANTYMKMSIGAEGEALVMEMSGVVGAVAPNKPEMEMDAQLFVNLSDSSGRYSTGWQHIYLGYYKEGCLYTHLQEMVTLNEVKYKTYITASEAARRVSLFGPFIFPESAVKEMSESEAGDEPDNEFEADSGTLLRFVLDASALRVLLDAIVQSKLTELLGETGGSLPMFQYGDAALTVLLNKYGGMSNINMSFPFEITDADGIRSAAEIEMHMALIQIGNVTIDFPDNLETYESTSQIYEI